MVTVYCGATLQEWFVCLFDSASDSIDYFNNIVKSLNGQTWGVTLGVVMMFL